MSTFQATLCGEDFYFFGLVIFKLERAIGSFFEMWKITAHWNVYITFVYQNKQANKLIDIRTNWLTDRLADKQLGTCTPKSTPRLHFHTLADKATNIQTHLHQPSYTNVDLCYVYFINQRSGWPVSQSIIKLWSLVYKPFQLKPQENVQRANGGWLRVSSKLFTEWGVIRVKNFNDISETSETKIWAW